VSNPLELKLPLLAMMLLVVFSIPQPFGAYLINETFAGTGNKEDITIQEQNTQATEQQGKKYKDWLLACGGEGLLEEQCYIYQNIFIQDSGLRILAITAGFLGQDNSAWLFFTLPLGVFLPSGMAFNIDDGEEIRPQIRICVADGCKGSIKLDEKLIDMFKKGKAGKVFFLDGNTQKQLTVGFSLKGFSKAFNALLLKDN